MEYKLKLIKKVSLNHDVSSFIFTKPENFKFTPGYSAIVSINKVNLEEKSIPLTFTSLNSDKHIEFLIKNYPGKLTEQFHLLEIGDEIRINSIFSSNRYSSPGTFIVAGIGIAPVIAILRQLKLDKALAGNKLLFTNKKKIDIILEEELIGLLGKENCIITLTQEKINGYKNERITLDFLKKNLTDLEKQFYVFGSETFIREIKNHLKYLKQQNI